MSDVAEQESVVPSDEIVPPDVSHLVTEDDAPVDNIFQEKQMRLLVEPLYSCWQPRTPEGKSRSFVAAADVGIFAGIHQPAVVPDVLLSLDVSVPDEFWRKERRSYYIWEFGKPPDIAIEVISNREGEELERKRVTYSKLRIAHYVVFDHLRLRGDNSLHMFELHGDLLVPSPTRHFSNLGLGLTEWKGSFEGKHAVWLRWQDVDGRLIPTGKERAQQEHERAEQEHERAEQEHERAEQQRERAEQQRERAEQEHKRAEQQRERAEQEHKRAERLAAKLRELGVSDDLNGDS
jgi:hypothetical protein